MPSQMDRLRELYEAYIKDERFSYLRHEGINFVGGSGPLSPALMLIGEAPGRLENARRIPFVGTAGNHLVNLLEDVGIDPHKVFLTNVVKHWPINLDLADTKKETRTPSEGEAAAHREYLTQEIKIVDPELVGLCGLTAINAIFPEFKNVFSHHGVLIDSLYVPLYHPAVICYNTHKKPMVRSGFEMLKRYMDNSHRQAC